MQMLRTRLQRAVIAMVGAVVLPAMSKATPVQPHPTEPIRIGVSVGLSGANSVVAPAVVQSSQLAVEEINANGGILGRPVLLEIMDDGSGAEGAQKAVEMLVFEKRVHALIAMQTSAARNAALPVVTRGRLPYLYTSFYEGRSCSPWMYVNAWVPEQQVAPVVDYLAQQKNARTYFLIGSDYAFGRGMLGFARQTIRKDGGQVVGEEYLPVDGNDWTAVIAKIRSAKPDALISATASGAPNLSLARQLKAADIHLPFGNLSMDESTAREVGHAATGMLLAGSYFPSIDTAQNRSFRMRMLMRFGQDLRPPNELSVPQYEAFFQYKAAVEAVHTTDAAKVLRALGEVTITGPRGSLRMDKGHHTPLPMRLGQVRSDGSIRILETFDSVDPGAQCPQMESSAARDGPVEGLPLWRKKPKKQLGISLTLV